jgi:ADP-heptose:LPS heptosyltransferase
VVAWAPGPDELDLIDQFSTTCLLDNGQVLSIAQIASLAPYTQLVIGNDSGLTHLLSYCRTNGVALFNNPRYRDSTRIGERYQTLCEQNLANLSVDSVMQQITVALQQTLA